jgi:translation elongation factor EF-1alpha
LCRQDAIRFDAFLKENDKLAHEALKTADKEGKVKSEKLQEIKKLKHAIAIVEGEKSKLLETLEDYERYKQARTLVAWCWLSAGVL